LDELDLSLPFDDRYRIAIESVSSAASYFAEKNKWRRIDTDWLFSSADLALQLDMEAVFFEKAHFLRDDNWGAVVFGKESHDERFASRNSLDRDWFAAIHINQIIMVV